MPEEGTGLQSLVGYHLRRASVFDLAGALAALQPVNGRPATLSVLMCIVEQPGVSAAEICRTLGLQRANIVQLLVDLEGQGLFTRETDAADQRIQRLYPTPEGKAAAQDWLRRLRDHEARMLERLSPAEQAELRRLLGRVWMEEAP
ncbi:MarR family winged helix-turn-helix transcriptional regulator [Falsirhodobacter sp. 1013]|uniref:MarR family winged helix-turn-helix transcriptional regulator n=1 Tax=Falsirhodobacter sp. 1013 TaxID=3417566 RepID=UPI003EBA7E6E